MPRVTLRYWAAMRAAAGRPEQVVQAATLGQALRQVRDEHGDGSRFAAVLDVCAVVVDDTPAGSRDHDEIILREGSTVELLPPFAGGSN